MRKERAALTRNEKWPEIECRDFRGRRSNWRGRLEILVISSRNMTANLFGPKRYVHSLFLVRVYLFSFCERMHAWGARTRMG